MTSKYPRLRTYVKKGSSGQRWISYAYDMRGTGQSDISLGTDYNCALKKWDELHNKKALAIGRIQEAADKWQQEVLPTYTNAETHKGYAKNLRTIIAWCRSMTWDELTLPMLRQYLRKRSAKVQANREMSVLQIIWHYAIMEGMTDKPWPATGIKNWKNAESARKFEVTDELFAAVYEQADQVLKDAMDIATTTGMRLTDARTCTMPVDGRLKFKSGKTGKWAYFEVSESPVLTALLERRGKVDCVTLLATSTGRPVSYNMLRSRYDTARMLAAEKNPHMSEQIKAMYLRDSRKRAADLASDVAEASKLLQHSSVKLTETHYRTRATKLKAVR